MSGERYIVHVDMDAFFAAIEQRDNPAYRSRPVVVGADPKAGKGRGVVSTCSYEARKFGIRSAMPISEAWRRCPDAVFVGVDMAKYELVSSQVYGILETFTPDIEPVGIDEAFLDITGSYRIFGTPLETCRLIKSRIFQATGLTASIGLAPTMMAAKIASDLKKPDGLVQVSRDKLTDFLWPLEIRRMWGLGAKTEEAMRSIGIATIGELAKRDPAELQRAFGKAGIHFHDLANGIDTRGISRDRQAKSISGEHTFDEDTSDPTAIESVLMRLCETVSSRLRLENFNCRTITVKIRLKGFKTYTRSVTIPDQTNFADLLYNHTKALYNNFDRGKAPLRLIGVKASNIVRERGCARLFGSEREKRLEKLHGAIDHIQNRFGGGYIGRATGMQGMRSGHGKR